MYNNIMILRNGTSLYNYHDAKVNGMIMYDELKDKTTLEKFLTKMSP